MVEFKHGDWIFEGVAVNDIDFLSMNSDKRLNLEEFSYKKYEEVYGEGSLDRDKINFLEDIYGEKFGVLYHAMMTKIIRESSISDDKEELKELQVRIARNQIELQKSIRILKEHQRSK
jgi:hypothetical protein